jgi:hypothetical protein
VLLISPYYNKPAREGTCKHYKMIAQSMDPVHTADLTALAAPHGCG